MSGMKDLFGDTPFPAPPPHRAFDGRTYEPKHDYARLSGQQRRLFDFMQDGRWHTLTEISAAAGSSEAGASARLRDLRKPQYGAHEVERRRVGSGLFEYRMMGTR